MELIKTSLYPQQKEAIKRLFLEYAENGPRATEGNTSLLKRILDPNSDFDITEILEQEINFYRDISPLLLGEIILIVLKNPVTL